MARKAKGFDMTVIAYDPYLPPHIAEALGVELVGFDEILERSDVISIHMNLTEETYICSTATPLPKCAAGPSSSTRAAAR